AEPRSSGSGSVGPVGAGAEAGGGLRHGTGTSGASTGAPGAGAGGVGAGSPAARAGRAGGRGGGTGAGSDGRSSTRSACPACDRAWGETLLRRTRVSGADGAAGRTALGAATGAGFAAGGAGSRRRTG